MSQKPTKRVITSGEVKDELHRKGITVAQWAKERGFDAGLVYVVLRGNRKCLRGDSHKIAVALGLKERDE